MARRLTARGKDRRRQLMEFAARRFAENGYDPTSVSDIVQGMGVGKGVFYWYFQSKEELFLEVLRDAQHELRRTQQQAIGDEADPLARIELGIRATMRWLAANRHLFTLFQFAAADERFSNHLRRGQAIAVSDVTRHVRDGIEHGAIADVDPLVMTHAILGVTNHLARVFVFERGDSPEDVADAAVTFCLAGLRALGDAEPQRAVAG